MNEDKVEFLEVDWDMDCDKCKHRPNCTCFDRVGLCEPTDSKYVYDEAWE
jgi:hypothetical protein